MGILHGMPASFFGKREVRSALLVFHVAEAFRGMLLD